MSWTAKFGFIIEYCYERRSSVEILGGSSNADRGVKRGTLFAQAIAIFLFVLRCPVAVADDPTILVCRDRQDPGIGATLVFDLARKRLVRSTNIGPNILFDDHNIPVVVTPGTIEWEVAHNDYVLDRATLELSVIGRIYICQIAPRQL